MHGMSPIRTTLNEALPLSNQRTAEIADKVIAIIRDGGSTDAALAKALSKSEQKNLSEATRTKILFKIDLCLSLLEIEPITEPLKSKHSTQFA